MSCIGVRHFLIADYMALSCACSVYRTGILKGNCSYSQLYKEVQGFCCLIFWGGFCLLVLLLSLLVFVVVVVVFCLLYFGGFLGGFVFFFFFLISGKSMDFSNLHWDLINWNRWEYCNLYSFTASINFLFILQMYTFVAKMMTVCCVRREYRFRGVLMWGKKR